MADETSTIDEQQEEDAPERLNLDVKIAKPSACERHVTVTIAREDIARYFDKAFSELMESAQVPGFRPGRAPRKLIESKFRKDVADRVKGSLLMDSMAQVTEEEKLVAISEPDLDPVAIELPKDGPMVFEFDLEVRPEFDMPNWKGLTIEKPVREFNDADVDRQLNTLLERYGKLVPHDGPAEAGDYISTKLTFSHAGKVLSSSDEEVIRIRPILSFRDGKIEDFDKLMVGVKPGETRVGKANVSEEASGEAMRGKEVEATFEVREVKKMQLPELNQEFLERLGRFENVEDLRDAVRRNLTRQLEYQQQQKARQQITAALTAAATWDLPPDLLRRQSSRELQRAVLELQRSGFSEDEIKAHSNELRQNSLNSTAKALKEHFILERIAEDQKVEDTREDYDDEVRLIAQQTNESVRRVRARLEKGGLMDALRNQIIERKTIDLILKESKFKEVPFSPETTDTTEPVDQSLSGQASEEEIPEAKYTDGPTTLPEPKERE